MTTNQHTRGRATSPRETSEPQARATQPPEPSDQAPATKDQGPRTKDEQTKDQGPRTKDEQTKDQGRTNQGQKTVSFKTIGCRLNQAETDQIEFQFKDAGYTIVSPGSICDVAIINTCTITHGAERDCARWARRLRRKGAKIVILAGCAVEHNGAKLKEQTGADIIANQKDKFHLLEILQTKQESEFGEHPTSNIQHSTSNETLRASVSQCESSQNISTPEPSVLSVVKPLQNISNPEQKTRALIKAQDGCSFRCSYCIVPDTRGKPYSLPLNDVLDDIRKKADRGFREIVITGANIGCYNDNGNTLINLLEKTEEISGIERIRISSIESSTAERAVIDFMATSSKLCHFLHLPLQSGDDQTLKTMRRHYTAAQYRETVQYAVARIPNLGLGTDIIVGFPSETDQAFQNTLTIVKELPFTNLHVFSYSKRSGTPAADMPNQIDPKIKKERSAELIALGKSKRDKFAKSFVGKNVNVLIEKNDNNGIASGWTEEYLPAKITAPNTKTNQIITFTPTKTDGDILK